MIDSTTVAISGGGDGTGGGSTRDTTSTGDGGSVLGGGGCSGIEGPRGDCVMGERFRASSWTAATGGGGGGMRSGERNGGGGGGEGAGGEKCIFCARDNLSSRARARRRSEPERTATESARARTAILRQQTRIEASRFSGANNSSATGKSVSPALVRPLRSSFRHGRRSARPGEEV